MLQCLTHRPTQLDKKLTEACVGHIEPGLKQLKQDSVLVHYDSQSAKN